MPTVPKAVVLLVDDQLIVGAAVRKMLTSEVDLELVHCVEPKTALDRARASGACLILQDLSMPDVDGFTLLECYRADPALADVPVIVLSSKEGAEEKSRAFRLGATDYLVKLPDRIELIARIRAHVRAAETRRQRDEAYRQLAALQVELEAKNKLLEQLSRADGLTGVANRRRFDEALAEEWRRAQRDASTLALVLIDVDHFKKYNDRYGHPAGDECLKKVAAALAERIGRPGDLVARYGGEEFALLLEHTDEDGASTVAELCRRGIGALDLEHEDGLGKRVSISAGVAAARPIDGGSPAQLVAEADAALYAGKRSGRDRVTRASQLGG